MNQPKERIYIGRDGVVRKLVLVREYNPAEQVKWHKLLPFCPISQWQMEDGSLISLADDVWLNAGWRWTAPKMLTTSLRDA